MQASLKSINTSVAGFWQEHLDKELFWHFWPKPFIAFWHQKERPLLPIYWKRDVHVTEQHPLSKFTGLPRHMLLHWTGLKQRFIMH